ncbi:phage terminase small subunit P27 family [Lactiplantibacillus pentosus]|uniref:Phage terminase small subunit P27 family n=1 Tax=Lactiplantibacillus pentosus TaxID=1589 RepID=A0AB37RMM0_LACPE|nr:phage terminase small subunit P27 family [Lactiplantibacillus pentosus]RMW49938.1 phage terminase small subunit P27 family [Lactiplantibacillus pentosus]RMW50481.1 phage terminase small subunit P27 family [Lactiplantibacillus pentosus]RMW57308.1 phage terminase small subunit P27 family [Lactiplantibacillus pentosus]RMW57674.1 phage terminase small subunit P27 family [Lactiplantibacillus pentosus]
MATKGNEISQTPPKYLKATGRSMWSRLMPLIGSQLEESDRALVESYCFNYQLMREAYEDIKKNGIQYPLYKIVMTPRGDIIDPNHFEGYKSNPATKTLSDATAKLNMLGQQLGLSPQSRAELAKLPKPTDKEQSMADLLNGGDNVDF